MISLISPYGASFPILHLETTAGEADLSLYGAHLLHWFPRQATERVLWMSPQAVFAPGKAIRGGIPLCWPWFGKHPANPSLPSHGTGRLSLWTLAQAIEHPCGTVDITLLLSPQDGNLPEARLDLNLGSSLSMRLTTTARQQELPYSAAFHSYFYVGNRELCTVEGLKDAPFCEYAAAVPHGEAPLQPIGPIDRIYYPHEGTVTVHDPVLNRRLRIERQGSNSFVVWNPDEAAAAMADVGAGNEVTFLCAETTVAPQEKRILLPGETHVLQTAVSVLPGA